MGIKNVNDIPDELFMPAKQMRSIARIKVVGRRERNSRNIKGDKVSFQEMGKPLGSIPRSIIFGKYVFLNGEKIKASKIADNETYTVMMPTDRLVMAVKLPDVEGNAFLDGKYVVCGVDKDGGIDKNDAAKLDSKMFRKEYYVYPSAKFQRLERKIAERKGIKREVENVNGGTGINDTVQRIARKSIEGKYGLYYKAVGVKRDQNGSIKSFVLSSKDGMRSATSREIIDIVKSGGSIDNLEVEVDQTGKKKIKGKGIKISELENM